MLSAAPGIYNGCIIALEKLMMQCVFPRHSLRYTFVHVLDFREISYCGNIIIIIITKSRPKCVTTATATATTVKTTTARALAPRWGELLPGAGSAPLVGVFFGATHDLSQLSHKLHGHDGGPEFPSGVVRSHGLLEMAQVLLPHLRAPLSNPRMLQQLGEKGTGSRGFYAKVAILD